MLEKWNCYALKNIDTVVERRKRAAIESIEKEADRERLAYQRELNRLDDNIEDIKRAL